MDIETIETFSNRADLINAIEIGRLIEVFIVNTSNSPSDGIHKIIVKDRNTSRKFSIQVVIKNGVIQDRI